MGYDLIILFILLLAQLVGCIEKRKFPITHHVFIEILFLIQLRNIEVGKLIQKGRRPLPLSGIQCFSPFI